MNYKLNLSWDRGWTVLVPICSTRSLGSKVGEGMRLSGQSGRLAGRSAQRAVPSVSPCRPDSVSLPIYLCCCVYFAVVSKERFCLKFSSLALVELRGSRIVFPHTPMCSQGLEAASQPDQNQDLGTSSFFAWSEGHIRQGVPEHESQKGKGRGTLRVQAWSQRWCPVVGLQCGLAWRPPPARFGMSPPSGGRESNRRTGPRGLLVPSRETECSSKPWLRIKIESVY